MDKVQRSTCFVPGPGIPFVGGDGRKSGGKLQHQFRGLRDDGEVGGACHGGGASNW